jgi:hypothetical protein
MNETHIFSRRKFLKLCGSTILALHLGHWEPVQAAAAGKSQLHKVRSLPNRLDIQYIRQLITADSATSRTIMCQAGELFPGVLLEYRLRGAAEAASADVSYDYFTDRDFACYFYTAKLSKLTPQQDYEYRFTRSEACSDWLPLRTAGRGSFKAIIFPDSQCVDYSCWQKTSKLAALRNPDAEFFVNMGDLVDNGEASWQWDAWFDAVSGLIEHMPLVPVMGNHEAYSLEWKYCLPDTFLHEFAVPDNGSKQFPGYYYSFDYGPVHFIVLNTQFEEIDGFRSGMLAEQLTWLRRDVKKSSKKWQVVLMHRDVLTYDTDAATGKHGGICDIGHDFMPAFDELGIDLVLTAHLHTYRNRGHLYDFQPADHGPVYIVTGVAGDIRYPGIWIDPVFDKKIAPQPETDNYLTLEASANALHLRCFLPNGSETDHVSLQK